MTPEQAIANAISAQGMTIKGAAAKAGIKCSMLYCSLEGRRNIRIDEYLKLCQCLRLDPRGILRDEGRSS